MFVKWIKRSRVLQPERFAKGGGISRMLIAQLVESYREGGKPHQRFIAYLGSVSYGLSPGDDDEDEAKKLAGIHVRERKEFYERCNAVLNRLDLSDNDRAKITAQLAGRVPAPSEEELAEWGQRIESIMTRLAGGSDPEAYDILERAWNAASNDDHSRFVGELLKAWNAAGADDQLGFLDMLLKAWDACSEVEQQCFLDALRQQQIAE